VTGKTTIDELLGGRVRLVQPKRGNRAAIDPLLLAAAVPAKPGECVLEMGCGTGAATLALCARLPDVRVVGFDLQDDLIGLAQESAHLSGFSDRARFIVGDLLMPPEPIAGLFDHVMANPPYRKSGSGNLSPDPARRLANVEGSADLVAWVRFALAHVPVGGTVTYIHSADRGGELADLFTGAAADTVLRRVGSKRVLVQARLGGSGFLRTLPDLALHDPDGGYSSVGEAILRGAAALDMF
jgi:tRNA1(Val) A37 N6-methylase TrmN6